MSSNPITNSMKTKNLMLLMGTNPLPNYVAARLLAKEDTQLHLVVTDEVIKAGIPERLLKLLGKDPSLPGFYVPVSATNPDEIYNTVRKRVENTPGSWGLHYTGGKKVMATHAYRGVEQALGSMNPPQTGVYSYLDADTMQMVVEQSGKASQPCTSKIDTPVLLWQLLDLHGKPQATIAKARWNDYPEDAFENRPLCEKLHREPFLPDLCEALKNAHLAGDDAFVEETIRRIPGLSKENHQRRDALKEWLCNGIWLEHYVLDRIRTLKDDLGINDYALGFESHIFDPIDWEKDIFESDVIALQNYRLFYFSVTTGRNKKANKLRLFEAYVRAQHLGGEQAKAALVTFYPKPDRLKKEIYDERHYQTCVFGPEHLENTKSFDEELKRWMKWED